VLAMRAVSQEIPESLFLIIGRGNAEERLRSLIDELHLSHHVIMKGWLELEKIPAYLKRASVGVVPHFITQHTNNTIPNKLFDYMYFRLPVVASKCIPIARILIQEGCGFTFSSCDELTKSLIELRKSSIRDAYGLRGRNAVISRYNWSQDSMRLNSIVNSIVECHNI